MYKYQLYLTFNIVIVTIGKEKRASTGIQYNLFPTVMMGECASDGRHLSASHHQVTTLTTLHNAIDNQATTWEAYYIVNI